jgi:hypothetical protein
LELPDKLPPNLPPVLVPSKLPGHRSEIARVPDLKVHGPSCYDARMSDEPKSRWPFPDPGDRTGIDLVSYRVGNLLALLVISLGAGAIGWVLNWLLFGIGD